MVLKNDCRIVARLRQELHARTTQEMYKMAPGDFSRQPILTFPRVATLILRGHKVSQQNALNKFFRELNQPQIMMTGAAYGQARQKIKPELFVHLNASLVEEFTLLSQADQSWQTWRGQSRAGRRWHQTELARHARVGRGFERHRQSARRGWPVRARLSHRALRPAQ